MSEILTPGIECHVGVLLHEDYSPEQIVGTSRKDGINCVSHERIYQYIWEDKKHKGDLHT